MNTITTGNKELNLLFSTDKTLEEQKRNFLLMLSRISQETDQLTAINAYKQLLRVNLELNANPDKLNVIIFSDELKACQPLIEIVKGACDQQAIVILNLDDLLQY